MPTGPMELFINITSKHVYSILASTPFAVRLGRAKTYDREASRYKVNNVPLEVTVDMERFAATYAPYSESQGEAGAGEASATGSDVGTLIEPTEHDNFERLIVTAEVGVDINLGIKAIEKREELVTKWGLDEIEPKSNRTALNFYGPPGTGKTMAARSIAHKLGKKLLQVDYAAIISKYVGDTAKHIRGAFEDAVKFDAILFFDEADSLLSKRTSNVDESFGTSVNQNRNVLMQEIDKFNGIIIFTTNFFRNYDEAMLRRIAQHVKFDLPDTDLRKKLIELHVPKKARANELISADVSIEDLAEVTDGFSGGDIKNVLVNALKSACINETLVTNDVLIAEVGKVRKAKEEHKKGDKGSKNPIRMLG